jgi:hypothetical protein
MGGGAAAPENNIEEMPIKRGGGGNPFGGAGAIMSEYPSEYPQDDQAPQQNLRQCRSCGRSFNEQALTRH